MTNIARACCIGGLAQGKIYKLVLLLEVHATLTR